jgi:hypothetical protein
MKYRTGALYNQKHVIWLKHSISLTCPLCPYLNSALHILSGGQHTEVRKRVIAERHNLAFMQLSMKQKSTRAAFSCPFSVPFSSLFSFLLVEEFYATRYQSGSFFLIDVRSGFSLPAHFLLSLFTVVAFSCPFSVLLFIQYPSIQYRTGSFPLINAGSFPYWPAVFFPYLILTQKQ